MSKQRVARRKLSEEDVRELSKVFHRIVERTFMPIIIQAVDDRVKEVLTSFYERAIAEEEQVIAEEDPQ